MSAARAWVFPPPLWAVVWCNPGELSNLISSVCCLWAAVTHKWGSVHAAQSEPRPHLCWATIDSLISFKGPWVQSSHSGGAAAMQQCRCLQGPSPLLSGASRAPGAQDCQALFPSKIPFLALPHSSLGFWFYLLFDDPKITQRWSHPCRQSPQLNIVSWGHTVIACGHTSHA